MNDYADLFTRVRTEPEYDLYSWEVFTIVVNHASGLCDLYDYATHLYIVEDVTFDEAARLAVESVGTDR